MVELGYTSWMDHKEYVHWDEETEDFIIDDNAPDCIKDEYAYFNSFTAEGFWALSRMRGEYGIPE